MKKVFVLAALAGSLFAVQAFGQVKATPAPKPSRTVQPKETLERATNLVVVPGLRNPDGSPSARSPYANRDVGTTYDCWDPQRLVGAFFLGPTPKMLMENVNFASGPWAGASNRLITEMDTLFGRNTGGTLGAFDVIITFYNAADVSFNGFSGDNTNMIRPGAVPISTFTLGDNDPAAGNAEFLQWDLTPLPGGGVLLPDGADEFYALAQIVLPGTTTQWTPNDNGPCFLLGTLNSSGTNGITNNACSPGTADVLGNYGRDVSGDGILIGSSIAPFAGANEHRQLAADADFPADGISETLSSCYAFRGNITVATPAAEDLGALADGVSTHTATVAGGGVKWYKVALPTGALDNAGTNGTFLDIDTEGSVADLSLAIFSQGGTKIWEDADSGSGVNAQMSFGIGRRPAVGDGKQYDGRGFDGTGLAPVKGLNAGTYYVAVAPAGTTFSDGFAVTSGPTGGAATINFNTNINSGTLAPSVPPIVNTAFGTIVSPGAQIVSTTMAPREVKWFSFTTCRDVDNANNVVINTNNTTALATNISLFGPTGNLLQQVQGVGASANHDLLEPRFFARGDVLPQHVL